MQLSLPLPSDTECLTHRVSFEPVDKSEYLERGRVSNGLIAAVAACARKNDLVVSGAASAGDAHEGFSEAGHFNAKRAIIYVPPVSGLKDASR